jgi:hypothetical protein
MKILRKKKLQYIQVNYIKKLINFNFDNRTVNTNKTLGFIIIRYVIDENTALYWKHCYMCIRKYYPEIKIIIIDDNSNYNFIKTKDETSLYKTEIIKSDYNKRGEFLPYYYYSRNKYFDTAFIIHDSVFINMEIKFNNIENYKIIWDTPDHIYDMVKLELSFLNQLNNSKSLIDFYKKKDEWKLCFGCMCIINHEYLKFIYNKYNFDNLLNLIINRPSRMAFERILGCILQFENKGESILDDINTYYPHPNVGITLEYLHNYQHLPIIKIWTGR